MYILAIATCNKASGEVTIPDDKAYEMFATYSDMLLLGEEMKVEIPDAGDSHPVRVTLMYASPFTPEKATVVASVFLLCEDQVEVMHDQRASSLLIPKGARG